MDSIVIPYEKDLSTGKYKRLLPDEIGYQSKSDAVKIATDLPFDRFDANTLPYARWGDTDVFPTWVRQQLEKVPLALRALRRLTEMMFAEGIGYVKNEKLAAGEFENSYIQEVEDFLFDNAIATDWFAHQCFEYLMFANTFSEAEQDNTGKVIGLWHKTAEFCRLEQQNKTTNRIENVMYSPEFQHNRTLTQAEKAHYAFLPLCRITEHRSFFENFKGRNFSFHTKQPSAGTSYYARLLWYELLQDKNWLSVAALAPRQAYALLKKQAILRATVTIPVTYFLVRHPDWDSYTKDRQQYLIKKKVKEIEDYMDDNEESSFKYFSQVCDEDDVSHEKIGKIEIELLDDKPKNGFYIADASVANLEILNILGLNPNQMQLANQEGKSMGAGSGSDSRVGYNTHILNNTLDQQTILLPLNIIARRNGWNVTFFIKHEQQVTTNVDKAGIDGKAKKSKKKPEKALKDGKDNGALQ
jgi:hypothetical protein